MRPLLIILFSGVVSALASDPEGVANLAAKSSLPSGRGLASQFSDDAGLQTHSDVIFADNFETGAIGEGWDETGNKNDKVLRWVSPGDIAGLGRRCLRVEAHLGQDTGGGLRNGASRPTPSSSGSIRGSRTAAITCITS